MAEINTFNLPDGTEITFEDYKARIVSEATGNPVVMDGLQGGVPFNSVSVSGKNLIPSDYMAKSGTYNGVTVTVKNDGRFDVNGTPTKSFTILSFAPSNYFLEGGKKYTFNCNHGYDINTFNIFVRVYNKDGVQIQGISTYPTTITANDGDYFSWVLWAVENYEISATDVEVQLELGDIATAYEPPITGRELTLAVGGENILTYPYPDSTKTTSGITFTDNGDGTITANGTAINDAYFGCLMNGTITGGKFILRGCPKGGQNQTYNMLFNVKKPDGTSRYVGDLGNGCEVELSDGETIFEIPIKICAGTTVTNLKFNPVALRNGSLINITPDSNPYTVPDDIRQQDGLNTLTVSAGTLEISGARKNSAIKKLWNEIDGIITTNADGDIILNY